MQLPRKSGGGEEGGFDLKTRADHLQSKKSCEKGKGSRWGECRDYAETETRQFDQDEKGQPSDHRNVRAGNQPILQHQL